MSKLDLTLLKNPTLRDIFRLFEHLTGRKVTEEDKRACEHLAATKAKDMIRSETTIW